MSWMDSTPCNHSQICFCVGQEIFSMGLECQNVDDNINLWYQISKLEKTLVGHGQCKRKYQIIVHGVVGPKNYIVVVTKCIFENYDKLKLFI